MQVGIVRRLDGSLYPITPIYVEGTDGSSEVFQALLDTGFTEYVALPSREIEKLNLTPLRKVVLEFANSTQQVVQTFSATIIWCDVRRTVVVHEVGERPTVGMELIADMHVDFDAQDLGLINAQLIEG